MLRRYAQEYGIDLGPTADLAPEYDPDSYGSPQSGLLDRLRALQAMQSQYRPVTGNGGQPPFAPQNPNFTPTPQGVRPFDAYSPYNPETYIGEGGGMAGRLRRSAQENGIDLGPTASVVPEYNPDSYGSPQAGLLARLLALHAEQGQYQLIPEPAHSLADRLQAYWDHPDPHGLVAMLKAASNGTQQAVQGSIDAMRSNPEIWIASSLRSSQ